MSEPNPKRRLSQADHAAIAVARGAVVQRNRMRAAEEMNEDATKKREKELRRQLKCVGHKLKKTPANHWTREHYDLGYQVVDDRKVVVFGASQREYDATLLQVECLVDALCAKPPAAPKMSEEEARLYDEHPELHIYPSFGRLIIACRSERAERFMASFCAGTPRHGLEDVPAWISGCRQFIDHKDRYSDCEFEEEFHLVIGYHEAA